MQPPAGENNRVFTVHGTVIQSTDSPEHYRQKLARIALDEMYQFVAILDANGTLLEVNRAALEGAGLTLSEVEGKPFWDCFWWAVSPEIRETLQKSVARASQGEFIRYDVEIYGRARGKGTIIIDFSLIPVKDETGRVVFIVPEGRDITEKASYEREIARKNTDLQALLKRIRELDEIKTQFFSNVSHELRTPLALIIGPADRLLRNDATLSSEQRQESARVIARNARMLLKHVNDLLDISKFEAGKLKIALQDTNVTPLLRLTASHFDLLAEDRHITFRVEGHDEVVTAIDPEKIQRVVMNLLSNAFKFVPDGGEVRTSIRSSKHELVVSIEDSGPGVKPELRHAIFERFRQGEGGTNRQFAGTGLGLAIAKEFIEMHHGRVEVLDSELGGACFQVTLPISRLSQTAPLSPAHHVAPTIIEGFIEELSQRPSFRGETKLTKPPDYSKSTILVVEDNVDMNRFISESLSATYHVISAFDGQQGLEKALASHPTLIITDIMMPRVSGVEMIGEIRKCPELADVPILLLSAKADEELKVKLLTEGSQDFVAKPFSEKDLLVRVRNLIDLKKSQERYRTLFTSMDEGFCTIEVIFDESQTPIDYRFLETNGAFEKQTALKDARGKRVRELVPHLQQYWFDIYGKVALTGIPTRFENHVEAMNRWHEVYAFRVGVPEHRQVAVFFNDITERKGVEVALRESEERMRLATEATAVGIWEWNTITQMIRWDAQMFRIYGIPPTPDGMVHYSIWSGAVLLEDLSRQEELLRDTAVRRGGYTTREFRIRRPEDGECRHIESVETVRTNSKGQAEWIVGTNLDITDRKHAVQALRENEGRLRAFSGQLEQEVQERTEELEQSQDRLRALATELNLAEQRERKRLAGELHDYLAQLLVLGRLKLGQMRRIGLSPQGTEMVRDTEDVLKKALEYTRTLMAELSPPVLQQHGLSAGLKWLGEQMQRSGLVVTVDVDATTKYSLPDDSAVLLFQSVRELLMNALKHADTNEVAIRLESAEGRLRIEVRDEGAGFDLAAASSASINTAMSSKFGLFSIRERMRALGGSFTLQSAPGEGTTATLILPLVGAQDPGTKPEVRGLGEDPKEGKPSVSFPLASSALLHAQARVRVLLVDDHGMVRQGLRSVLESYADVEVVGESCNGEEAVASVERLQPSIVVMDNNMPRMNGIEATAEITSRYPGVIVIGLSVQSGGANELAMKNVGAAMLLTKDVAVYALYRAIRETLNAKEMSAKEH